MAEIRTIHTARKAHRCQGDTGTRCRRLIHRGDRYLLATMPPDSELGNEHWERMKVCRGCAEQWGQPLEEQATPRRSTRTRRRTTAATRPLRRHVDEPRLTRPVVDVHLPA